jgi:hypothetical protein
MFERVYFETAGDGYWSDVSKEVDIEDMRVTYVSSDKDFGELCVYFDTSDWDVNKDGLIYTDKLFLEQLRAFLEEQGLAGFDVSYSEQGMQGDNYVSLDIGTAFIASWETKFGADSLKESINV